MLYAQSWAARKFIDIPVDDMFIRWRQWDDDGEEMGEAETEHRVQQLLARAMKAGRLYGTAVLVMVTREGPLDTELIPERVRPGDLSHLLVFDRYDLWISQRDDDLMSPTYGQALEYTIHPARGVGVTVHHSRVLRFDGLSPLASDGYTVYDQDWGLSEIIPAILAIMQDQGTATGAAHLAQEASIPVLRLMGYREALAGGGRDPDDPTPEQLGESINRYKSIYRTLFLDSGDEFDRTSVTWAGLPDIMDRFARRLAACANIPETRFWGRSPAGLNASGDSDMANYAGHVAAMQTRLLTEPLSRLDMVLSRHAGMSEPPEYSWPSLIDQSDAEQATTLKARAEALRTLVDAGIIDEDEARDAIAADELFPDGLSGPAPEVEIETAPMPGGSIIGESVDSTG